MLANLKRQNMLQSIDNVYADQKSTSIQSQRSRPTSLNRNQPADKAMEKENLLSKFNSVSVPKSNRANYENTKSQEKIRDF